MNDFLKLPFRSWVRYTCIHRPTVGRDIVRTTTPFLKVKELRRDRDRAA